MLHKKTVKPHIMILAFIALLGVLSMTIGFYNNDSLYLNIGIPVTILSSLTIAFQNILPMNKNKRRAGSAFISK